MIEMAPPLAPRPARPSVPAPPAVAVEGCGPSASPATAGAPSRPCATSSTALARGARRGRAHLRHPAGEMVGCLGPNGAGKSTTVKMLTGILHPTAGEVRVLGMSPQRQRKAVARRIGVVFGQRTQLWWDLPLIESLDLLRHIYRVPGALPGQPGHLPLRARPRPLPGDPGASALPGPAHAR